jgi:thiol-disulfide isomerase/thioredoxin
MKNFLILVLLFFVQIALCQSNIKLNQKAPQITISDWVLNVPKDKNLNNKFIVLEFWATWCGPCIKAVPHLNEIQERTKHKDLYFISITDESVEKINRISKRIIFNSIVVSDQSKKTHINFGNGIDGLEVYPFTVLIDNKGIIKWIGSPVSLTEEIVNDFLYAKLTPSNAFEKIEAIETVITSNVSLVTSYDEEFNEFLKLYKNKDILFNFKILKTESLDQSASNLNKNAFLYNSITIKEIFSEILKYNPNQIEITEELNKQRYKLVYKNYGIWDNYTIENNLVAILKLKITKSKKVLIINEVAIKNEKLLEATLDEGMSSISDAGEKIVFTGSSIISLMSELNNFTNDTYEFNGKENNKFYDFIIDITSKQSTIKSLNSYGLEVKTKSEEREIVKIEVME